MTDKDATREFLVTKHSNRSREPGWVGDLLGEANRITSVDDGARSSADVDRGRRPSLPPTGRRPQFSSASVSLGCARVTAVVGLRSNMDDRLKFSDKARPTAMDRHGPPWLASPAYLFLSKHKNGRPGRHRRSTWAIETDFTLFVLADHVCPTPSSFCVIAPQDRCLSDRRIWAHGLEVLDIRGLRSNPFARV